ncbi:hypothetical protein OPT61_g1141 [Boeremia exigua]|uniref:Uncharacterized protein n=1 Tax=Boeremia exigua TaxID=749465 RepID=A0ACC2IR93_9PLEO|nr:hypothetical protein OPT61_g1141 [Boeremia exigua]
MHPSCINAVAEPSTSFRCPTAERLDSVANTAEHSSAHQDALIKLVFSGAPDAIPVAEAEDRCQNTYIAATIHLNHVSSISEASDML